MTDKFPHGKTPTGRPRYRCYGSNGRQTLREKIIDSLYRDPGQSARDLQNSTGKTDAGSVRAIATIQTELRRMLADREIERSEMNDAGEHMPYEYVLTRAARTKLRLEKEKASEPRPPSPFMLAIEELE